jgi:hypothetical protein
VKRLSVLAALAALALAVSAAALASTAPHVRLVRLQPTALVRGTGFKAKEHLVVRLAGVGVESKRVVAGAPGTFRVTLTTPPPRACGQYLLTVLRPAAKPVRIKIGPPECAPSDGPGS